MPHHHAIGFLHTASRAALALACALALPAAAQTADSATAAASSAADNEEIIVTGIRGSLTAAAELKRNASGILDSITSEDLGKFPDSNVAESLQRIPGVSIDRNGGEGQFITVRGFGPEFTNVLVNGRTFASDNTGREFSFDLLAAELISGADVYKTSQANLQDGGIGATVNIKTPRPLDLGGFKAIVSGKGVYEQLSGNVAPQVFGLVSTTFGDKLGALLAVSYQRRESQINFIENRGYLPGVNVGPSATPLFRNVFAPRNQDVGTETQDRERLGINFTGQFRPIETLTLTVDGLYNQFDVDSEVRSLGNWFEPSSYTAAAIDANRTVTSLTTSGNADLIATSNNRYTKTRAVGINGDWEVNDQLRVKLDASWSRATNAAGGRNYFTVIGIPSRYSFVEAQGAGFPSVFGYTADVTDPRLGRSHIALRQGNSEAERILEYKGDVEWKGDGDTLKAVRIGLVNTNRRKNSQLIQSDPNTLCLYCGYAATSSPALLQPFSLDRDFLGGNGRVPLAFQSYDPQAYFAFLESPAAAAAADVAFGRVPGTTAAQLARTNGFAATPQPSSFSINERVYAGYIDADIEGRLGGMPWFVNLGARYVHTEISAAGSQLALVDILPIPTDPTIYNAVFANGGVAQASRQSSSYDFFLPNINVRINVADDILVRFGASRTLTRPQVQDLAPRTNFDVIRPASLDASGGNPALQPFTSDNFDISLEWYPTQTTTLSIAGFYKRVRNFIVQTRENEVFTIANAGNLPIGNGITGPNAATFNVRRPRNAEAASVRGLELNAVHTFDWLPRPFNGLGVQLNATFVSSNAAFDPASTSTSFALEGLGDSQNATVFYENDGISARFAYNRRERFLENLVTPGQGGDPVFRRTFEQIDVRAGYQVTSFAQIFFEGINVLGARNVQTGRFDNQVLTVRDTGARYAFGVRADF